MTSPSSPVPPSGAMAGSVLPIRRAEELIATLQGVLSVRIVPNETGAIDEIHVLTTDVVLPKQTVRNIESALMAQLGLRVNHRKISIATTLDSGRALDTGAGRSIIPSSTMSDTALPLGGAGGGAAVGGGLSSGLAADSAVPSSAAGVGSGAGGGIPGSPASASHGMPAAAVAHSTPSGPAAGTAGAASGVVGRSGDIAPGAYPPPPRGHSSSGFSPSGATLSEAVGRPPLGDVAAPGRRVLVFEDVEIRRSRTRGVLCRVTLSRGGVDFDGEAEGQESERSRIDLAARATVVAIAEAMKGVSGSPRLMTLEGSKLIEAFDREFIFVSVQARSGRDGVMLTGSCEVRESAETSAVLAVLDATNRWMHLER